MVRVREIQVGAASKLVIHELDDVCDSVTGRAMTGSWVWDSSLLLFHFISTQTRFDLRAKTVLELGAGTGLPGLTASRLGAARVILTDVAPLLPGLMKNVEANGMEGRVEACELVWGSDELPSPLTELIGGRVDLVLMSDVFYDPGLMTALAKTLKMVCGRETKVWAATEVRESVIECLSELASRTLRQIRAATTELGEEEKGGPCDDLFAVYLISPPQS